MAARLDPQPWMTAAPSRRVMAVLEAERPGCARFVGGCVRNALLGEPVADIDIATQLTPDRVAAICRAAGIAVHPTGIEHGTLTLVADHAVFEVTTLRRDVETDGRRATVAFTEDWAEDAARRDFRMNALYADAQGQVFDPTGGGLDDVAARRIVFVGDADTRIREDYLRVLRFFRFHAWYGRGEPDREALDACGRLKAGLKTVSAERVWMETRKLLGAPNPLPALEAMRASGVAEVLFPEFQSFDELAGLLKIEETPDPLLRLLTLVRRDAAVCGGLADRLRLSNAERERLMDVARQEAAVLRVLRAEMTDADLRLALYENGARAVTDIAWLAWARDVGAVRWREVIARAGAWMRPVLLVNGEDALAAGVEAGPAIGKALREVEAAWKASDFTLDRTALLALLSASSQTPPTH